MKDDLTRETFKERQSERSIMEITQGDTICLSNIDPIMTDQAFEKLLIGKSSNTTIPYMRKAKSLIIRGLLTRGTDGRAVNENKQIIGGTYNKENGQVFGRIFILQEVNATLRWQGPTNLFRQNYMRIRDELVGKVPYRLYGKAANRKEKIVQEIFNESIKKVLTQEVSYDLTEKLLEDILAKYPDLIEEGLSPAGRQVNIDGKAIDLLFKDRYGNTLIVELKKGTIKRIDVGQILDYAGYFCKSSPTIRIMLIGTHIPKNIQASLDHYGIEYKFFSPSVLREYLINKSDNELLSHLNW